MTNPSDKLIVALDVPNALAGLELANTIGRLLDRPTPRKPMPVWLLRLAGQVYAVGGLFTRQEPRLTPEKVALVTSRVHADGSKAVQELGFDATVPLETMLRRCIDWMRETGRL